MPLKQFSGLNNLGVKDDFGQQLTGEDFLPDQEAKYASEKLKQESSIKINVRAEEMLKHNEESGGILFKYDLPTVNTPITFRNQNQLAEFEEQQAAKLTPTEELLNELEVDKDTAFESFVIKMQQKFNNEVDMYGDIREAGSSQLKVLEFGTPIPFEYLADDDLMKRTRSYFRVNADMPGALELVHPNKFLASKKTGP